MTQPLHLVLTGYARQGPLRDSLQDPLTDTIYSNDTEQMTEQMKDS